MITQVGLQIRITKWALRGENNFQHTTHINKSCDVSMHYSLNVPDDLAWSQAKLLDFL